ncbi:BatA domain-containing protein [uncultured Pedobacter sp.]|uniref:BatA domain-containing protein n=1 Tax=uncultured Pedobacter sp. TaxID=246139 RepID=UPI0025E580C2|nr:BatA domain-containing protein [uncultured Pedobacter sp.]
MHFLYPIGLLALAGLIVPFIIHLWNVKQGKTIKIGSIALLGESSRASARSFKINDWLLLLLRCLLLALLAFLMAKPYLKKIAMAEKRTGWVLLDRATFKQVFESNKKTIDSLLKKGYEIHDFNVGFKTLTLKDTADDQTKPATNLSFTALLHAADQFVPARANVYLFANRRLTYFGNELPVLNYKLNWVPLNQTDSLSSWITGYAEEKYEAKSSPSSTTYRNLNSGDLKPINVALHQAPGTADGKYLIAALKAIGSFTNRKIMINSPAAKADIGFWLSGDAATAKFKSSITTNGILLQYKNGKVIDEPSFINLDGRHVKLSKRIASANNTKKIWSDGFGNAILTKEKADGLRIFHFYSRFNPAWNELVWDGLFVKALMPMVISPENTADFGFENSPADQRRVSARQNNVFQTDKTNPITKIVQNVPIQPLFWAAALLIFVTERILSFRKKPDDVKNGR